MKVTLIGFKTVDFTDEDSGKKVQGISLYISFPDADTVGEACERQFVNKSIFDAAGITSKMLEELINDEINIEYNRRGKIGSVSI